MMSVKILKKAVSEPQLVFAKLNSDPTKSGPVNEIPVGAGLLLAYAKAGDTEGFISRHWPLKFFVGDEAKLFSYTNDFVKNHKCLPTVQTLAKVFPGNIQDAPEPVSYYADKVQERYQYRTINRALTDCNELMKKQEPLKAMAKMKEAFAEVDQSCTLQDKDEFGSGITAHQIMTADDTPIQYCVNGRVPSGLVIIGGRPKAKKSWWTLQLAIAKATAGQFMGVPTSGGRVLYLGLEDNLRRIRNRFKFFGITAESTPNNLHVFHEWPTGVSGVEKLKRWLTEYPDTGLIVIDVLQRFRGPRDAKLSPYEADYQMMGLLHSVTQTHLGLTTLVVHHIRKAAVDDPVEALNGTFGIAGGADAYIILRREGSEWIAHIDGRDWESWDHDFSWEFVEQEGWRQIGVASELSAKQQEIVNLAEKMGHLTPSKLSEHHMIAKSTAHQSLHALVAKGAMKVFSGKYYPIDSSITITTSGTSPDEQKSPAHDTIETLSKGIKKEAEKY